MGGSASCSIDADALCWAPPQVVVGLGKKSSPKLDYLCVRSEALGSELILNGAANCPVCYCLI